MNSFNARPVVTVGERLVQVPAQGVFLANGYLYVDGELLARSVEWSEEWLLWFATLVPPFDPHTISEDKREIEHLVAAIRERQSDPAYQPKVTL